MCFLKNTNSAVVHSSIFPWHLHSWAVITLHFLPQLVPYLPYIWDFVNLTERLNQQDQVQLFKVFLHSNFVFHHPYSLIVWCSLAFDQFNPHSITWVLNENTEQKPVVFSPTLNALLFWQWNISFEWSPLHCVQCFPVYNIKIPWEKSQKLNISEITYLPHVLCLLSCPGKT